MAVVRIDVEVDPKSGKVAIRELAGGMEEVEKKSKGAKAGVQSLFEGFGQGIGQRAFDMVLAGLQAIPQAIFSATTSTAKYADDLAAMTDSSNLAGASLQALEVKARLGGGSLTSVTAGVNKMMIGLNNGSASFGKLGLSIDELRQKRPEQVLDDVAKAIDRLDPNSQGAARVAIFGKAGNELAGTLKEAASGATELGGALSQQALDAAADLQDKLDLVAIAGERVVHQFGAAVASSPELQRALEDIADFLVEVAQYLERNGPEIRAFFGIMVDGAREAVREVKELLGWVKQLAQQSFGGQVLGKMFEGNPIAESYRYKVNDARRGSGLSVTADAGRLVNGKYVADRKPGFAGADDDAAEAKAERARAAQRAAEEARKDWDKFYADMDKRGRSALGDLENDIKKRVKAMAPTGESVLKDLEDENAAREKFEEQREQASANRRQMEASEHAQHMADLAELSGALYGLADAAGDGFGAIFTLGAGAVGVFQNLDKKTRESMSSLQKWANVANTAASIMSGPGGAKGALQGAAQGASAGAAFGPWGAVIGGGVGAVLGIFGGPSEAEKAAEKKKLLDDTVKTLEQLKQRLDAIRLEKVQAAVGGLAALFKNVANQAALTPAELDRINGRMDRYKEKLKAAGVAEDEFAKAVKQRRRELETAAEHADDGKMGARLNRLGLLTLVTLEQLKAQGLTIAEAFEQIGPAIDAAVAAAEAHGIELTGQMAELARYRALVADNKDLVSAAEGIGAVISALRATGSLTQENADLALAEVSDLWDEMIGKGFTAEQTAATMAKALYDIKKAADAGLISLTAEQQAMIDFAEKSGAFENLKDPMEEMLEVQKLMLEATAALAQAFGAVLPESVRKYIAELKNIPSVPGPPGSSAGGGTGSRPNREEEDLDVPGHAGGYYNPSMGYGPYTGGATLLAVHPRERVDITPASQNMPRPSAESTSATSVHMPLTFAPQISVSGAGDARAVVDLVAGELLRAGGRFEKQLMDQAARAAHQVRQGIR